MKTWGDIKLFTLQKLFSSSGTTIKVDSSNSEYINSMPQVANEGLQLLATAGKFIIKKVQILHRPVQNLLNNGFVTTDIASGEELVYEVDGARAYYFRLAGNAIVTIAVDGETLEPIANASKGFEIYRGLIPEGEHVVVTIHATNPSTVKNFCLYGEVFANAEDVPDYEEYVHYSMKELAPDFYQLAENELYYEGDGEPSYLAAVDYYQEAYKSLVIPRDKKGAYTVFYKAYPDEITLDTPDDYEMSLDPEVSALLPLYMASELYKDDDNSVATVYRNEFEVGREALSQGANIPRKEEFVSESGWW